MGWFHQNKPDKPFDVLGTFEVDRLLMLGRLFQRGRVHQTMIHCYDGRLIHLDTRPDWPLPLEVRKDLLSMLQIAYDAVATTYMMTTQDGGTEVASATMFLENHSLHTAQGYVWKARIQRGPSGAVTDCMPLGHAQIPTGSPVMASVTRRPSTVERTKMKTILSKIPEASAPWITK